MQDVYIFIIYKQLLLRLQLLAQSGTSILEPVMALEVVIPEEYSSMVLADLSRRRSVIENITLRGKSKV